MNTRSASGEGLMDSSHQVKLNVAQIVSSIAEQASGPTYSVLRLCDSLVSEGHDVQLLTLDWTPDTKYPFYARSFEMGFGPRRLGRSPPMHRWLTQQACTRSLDIIHSHGMWMMPNVYPAWVAARHRLPLVVSPRGCLTPYALSSGSKIKKCFWPLVQSPALNTVTCFHATAEAEYVDIRRMGFKQPVAVIPNGIDLPDHTPRLRKRCRTLLFLGRVHPIKGLDMLLPAWARVQSQFPDWELLIVGSDDGYHGSSGHLSEMKELASRLRLQRIRFEGPSYGSEKLQNFRDASLYVLPTYSENFGLTVAEALAVATPAIVTMGAPWKGLDENKAGWWIEIGVEPLVAALTVAMAQSEEVLAAMGDNGREWMQREFLWSSIARQMADIYEWICGRSASRPSCVRLD